MSPDNRVWCPRNFVRYWTGDEQWNQKRLVSQGPPRVLVGTEDFDVLFTQHPGEDRSPVRGEFEQGTDASTTESSRPRTWARALLLRHRLGVLINRGSDRVEFDITRKIRSR